MKHHWRKMLEPDGEGRPHLKGAQCEWCRISKAFDDMPADVRAMFHSREASDLRVAWAWLHSEFPGECPGPNLRYLPRSEAREPVEGEGAEAWHDYRVVYANRLDTLCAEVSTAMSDGWLPHGSMAVHNDTNHMHMTMYYQPMVRR